MQYFQVSENNNERRRVFFHLVDATDGITPEAGEAGGTPTISFNGRTPVNTLNSLVAIDASKGDYYLELATSEIAYPGLILLHYKSANTAHFAQECQVMAFDPYTQYGQFGGGGGVEVDYKKIQKMIDGAVDRIPKPIEPREPDYTPIADGLQAVIAEIRELDIPKPEKPNFEPILKKLDLLDKDIRNIDLPKCDHQEVIEAVERSVAMLDPRLEDTAEQAGMILERIRQYFDGDIEKVKQTVAELAKKFNDIPYVVLEPKKETNQAEKTSVLDEYLKL